ncbi:MAG TPA: glucans biosynthesis glucosyltransferase MdoH [Arenicellales bacterium]|nr:glucans biosynthesis glucosyltransferase MdoH [Arenicellales bacterium]
MYLGNTNWLENPVRLPAPGLRRLLFFSVVLATVALGVSTMLYVLNANGMSTLEGWILVLFSITFTWISLAFWTAVAGFAFQLTGRDPLSLGRSFDRGGSRSPIVSRTAIVMPIYNEDTARAVAGLEATCRDLLATGEAEQYDFYVLSDSNDPQIAAAEESAIRALRGRLGDDGRIFYRRRERNEGRKAGNIADFCRRWGAYYDYMIVLDADSVMTGPALLQLTRAMQANPSAGIIQTVPIPVRQKTMFGRFMQFAAGLYSPMLATGMAFWQGDIANYWGHNAIIRIDAFMNFCGLPSLPGKPPLGGEILSHDFVEAALMRRGGYHVYLFPELEGSYEETPGNLLDYAKRDRRWAEGNLQHLRLVAAYGLHPLNRLYFVLGALAYVCSFLWLIMLAAGTVDAIGKAVSSNEFFVATYQLHPHWTVSRTDEMLSLLAVVIGMLFLPKFLAVALAALRTSTRRAFGGGARLAFSTALEIVFSVLIAPVMMIYHACFVSGIVLGRRATWGPQSRDGQYVPVLDAVRSTALMTLAAGAWAAVTAAFSAVFAAALTPVLAGMILAAPLVSASSSQRLGLWLRRKGLLLSPCETRSPEVLQTLDRLLREPPATVNEHAPATAPLAALPPARYRAMPSQSIDRGPRWDRRVVYRTRV